MVKWSPSYRAKDTQVLFWILYPLAIGLLFFLAPDSKPAETGFVLLLGLTALTASGFATRLPLNAKSSTAFAASFAALVVFGPLAGMIVELFGGVSRGDIRERTPWYVVTFNSAQSVAAIGLAGILYRLAGGEVLSTAGAFTFETAAAIVVSAFGYALASTGLVSLAIAFDQERSVSNVWLFNFARSIPDYLVLGLVGGVVAYLYRVSGSSEVVAAAAALPLVLAAQAVFHAKARLRAFKDRSVKVFVKAVEVKDAYTSGHSERVSEYATRIARDPIFAGKFKVREQDVEAIRYAGYLHDIGKIGVSKRILTKKGGLTEDEYERVKEHPELGALILKHSPALRDVLPGVLFHHEKVNGRGYATGMTGDAIPMIARILAVADSFDAMTSERPYRPPFSRQAALDELFAGIGVHYDRTTVETMARVLKMRPSWEQQATLEGGCGDKREPRSCAGSRR